MGYWVWVKLICWGLYLNLSVSGHKSRQIAKFKEMKESSFLFTLFTSDLGGDRRQTANSQHYLSTRSCGDFVEFSFAVPFSACVCQHKVYFCTL